MSDTCKQASEAPAISLNPVAVVTSYATHRDESGRVKTACQIAPIRDTDLAFGVNLFTNKQVDEYCRIAVRERLETEAAHVAGEFAALREHLNDVYFQRNQLAIALGRMALIRQQEHAVYGSSPFEHEPVAGYSFDEKNGRAVVYVTLPMGHQVSWHMDDKTTEYLKRLGPKPLPLFAGNWDGTFLAREIGWPLKYVRTQKSFCEQAANFGQSPFTDRPEGATHYRVCTGGKNRYYKEHFTDGEWLYWHPNDSLWHPTDLSDDYLEEHIHRIDCDTQASSSINQTITAQGGAITNMSLPQPKHRYFELRADDGTVIARMGVWDEADGKADSTALYALSTRVTAAEGQIAALQAVDHAQPQATLEYLASLIAEYPLRKKEDQPK